MTDGRCILLYNSVIINNNIGHNNKVTFWLKFMLTSFYYINHVLTKMSDRKQFFCVHNQPYRIYAPC